MKATPQNPYATFYDEIQRRNPAYLVKCRDVVPQIVPASLQMHYMVFSLRLYQVDVNLQVSASPCAVFLVDMITTKIYQMPSAFELQSVLF